MFHNIKITDRQTAYDLSNEIYVELMADIDIRCRNYTDVSECLDYVVEKARRCRTT